MFWVFKLSFVVDILAFFTRRLLGLFFEKFGEFFFSNNLVTLPFREAAHGAFLPRLSPIFVANFGRFLSPKTRHRLDGQKVQLQKKFLFNLIARYHLQFWPIDGTMC
jgi:hypothetical protein